MDNRWRTWDEDLAYGQVLYKRAVGELPEMESGKAAARVLKDLVRDGDHVLDVGCGAGHYLRSLRNTLSCEFFYTGADATANYVELAQKAFAGEKGVQFRRADAFHLPFEESSFDIAMANNLFLHLPSIQKPLAELIRVAKKYVVVRTLIGSRSFRILDVEGSGDEFDETGEPKRFHYYNIYSRAYLEHLLSKNKGVKNFQFVEDWAYDPEKIQLASSEQKDAYDVTKMLGKWQVNGYILQPWTFVKIEMA